MALRVYYSSPVINASSLTVDLPTYTILDKSHVIIVVGVKPATISGGDSSSVSSITQVNDQNWTVYEYGSTYLLDPTRY